MKHVDADDFGQRTERTVNGPLFGARPGAADGPFARSLVVPDAHETVVAAMIWRHQGREKPIALASLVTAVGLSEREVKAIVEQLVVTHKMRIGARRAEPWGYFIVVDAADLKVAVAPYQHQIFSMWQRLRVLLSAPELRELLGQLRIDESTEVPGE